MAELPALSAETRLRTRVNLALQHLRGAARCSQLVGSIEQQNEGKSFGPFFDEVLGYASASVLLSVAAAEAYINELFADRCKHFPSVPAAILDRVWTGYERKPILLKYELALDLFGNGTLDKDGKLYADMTALVRLRNGLVHFQPEWFGDEVAHQKLSERLAGRFKTSPWLTNEGAFPRAWATHDCTRWSVHTVLFFIEAFDREAGRSFAFAKFVDRIAP